MLRPLLIFLLTIGALPIVSWATHNRAGEITYEQLDDLTIRATITLYTQTSSQAADRDSLLVFWGDGTSSSFPRTNGDGQPLPNDVKLNFYVGTHTYPGRGTYTMSMLDPNRVANILNVNPPNSVNIPFYLETTLTLLNPVFNGRNNSAILLAPPLEYACLGQVYTHNPNAFDPDGDSLAYEWTIPKQDVGENVPNYIMPELIEPGANNVLELDERTGTITWAAPQRAGIYNVAFLIKEYREGVLLNEIVRDMQIIVEEGCAENRPPTLAFQEEWCVEAPDSLTVPIVADDPDGPGQSIRVEAIGSPLTLAESPAVFNAPMGFNVPPVDATFVWNINCDQVREETYDVLIRAIDDFAVGDNTEGLTTVKSFGIEVVGPPPQNVVVDEAAVSNEVRWDRPYLCGAGDVANFRGFVVWRKENEDGVTLGSCNTDLATQGYEIVGFRITDATDFQYFFEDDDIEPGALYCYRVTALFALETDNGQLFNEVQSRPSNFACSAIRTDIPFMTKASVGVTSEVDGLVEVEWIPPFLMDFDTSIYVPPYRFELYRDGQELLQTREFVTYGQIPSEFAYDDSQINTQDEDHRYSVRLFSNDNIVGEASPASTMFLSASNVSDGIQLRWTDDVPWTNEVFEIMRLNNSSGEFESIGEARSNRFIDENVELDSIYCYKILAQGRYFFIPVDSIINFSQELCATRAFDFPPCDPVVRVTGDCEDASPTDSFEINIEWELRDCPDLVDDLAGYRLFFVPNGSEDTVALNGGNVVSGNDFAFRSLRGMTGCFFVSAVNRAGLESPRQNFDCFQSDPSCVLLELPNAFSPNGDNRNDIYKPINYRFVNSFEFMVFNRWGNRVFSTQDVEINWDGTDDNGEEVQPGVYFYECNYGYRDFDAEVPTVQRNQTGFIEVLK